MLHQKKLSSSAKFHFKKHKRQIMQNAIAIAETERGPRVHDIALGAALGFARITNIRQLIKANFAELNQYDEVCMRTVQTSAKGGRPTTEYWLNEPQALLICMFARTDNAALARRQIIEAFMIWRRAAVAGRVEALEARVAALESQSAAPRQLSRDLGRRILEALSEAKKPVARRDLMRQLSCSSAEFVAAAAELHDVRQYLVYPTGRGRVTAYLA